jgi:hypothetical protein
MAKLPNLPRGKRLSGDDRAGVGDELLDRYKNGKSIREICTETGYSIGRTRRLLQEAGVEFRQRGGANHRNGQHP